MTGTPLRATITALRDESPLPPTPDRRAHLLVTGGSRDGGFLAAQVPALAEGIARTRSLEVWHQTDAWQCPRLADAYAAAGVPATVVSELADIAAAYRWADLAVTRGGAGTLSELLVAGLPALVVPLADAAENHQRENARVFAGLTGGRWVTEQHWERDELTAWIVATLTDSSSWRAIAERSRGAAPPDATTAIVGDCELLMRNRW